MGFDHSRDILFKRLSEVQTVHVELTSRPRMFKVQGRLLEEAHTVVLIGFPGIGLPGTRRIKFFLTLRKGNVRTAYKQKKTMKMREVGILST